MWKLLKFLPRKAVSRAVGGFVHWRGPRIWAFISIHVFALIYRINLREIEKSVWQYPSLGEFFVRRLKKGVRPIAPVTAVHCADSVIFEAGPIGEGGRCLQAKGRSYMLRDFLVDAEWKDKYAGGFFVSYYLCPTDYHRVHSPVDGFIRKVTYVPGDLWPVHKSAVEFMDIYGVNERVIVEIVTELGAVAVVFVGAMNVGSIELAFDPGVRGNFSFPFIEKVYETPKEIRKGDELGAFRMGSTVVVLLSEEYRLQFAGSFRLGPKVRVNSALTSS